MIKKITFVLCVLFPLLLFSNIAQSSNKCVQGYMQCMKHLGRVISGSRIKDPKKVCAFANCTKKLSKKCQATLNQGGGLSVMQKGVSCASPSKSQVEVKDEAVKPPPVPVLSIVDSNNKAQCDIDGYRKRIHNIHQKIKITKPKYDELSVNVENFSKDSRVSFCTRQVNDDGPIQGVIKFDADVSDFSTLSTSLDYLSELPGFPLEVVRTIKGYSEKFSFILSNFSKVLSLGAKTITILNEAHHAAASIRDSGVGPLGQSFREYQNLLDERQKVINNARTLLQKYYCTAVFVYDKQLYDLYNNEIKNDANCNEFEKNALSQSVTRDRPGGMGAIWVESVYQESKKICDG